MREAKTPSWGDTQKAPLASWPEVGGGPRAALGQAPPHPSPLDGVSQEPHDVVPFCPGSLEALGPVEKDALWGQGRARVKGRELTRTTGTCTICSSHGSRGAAHKSP